MTKITIFRVLIAIGLVLPVGSYAASEADVMRKIDLMHIYVKAMQQQAADMAAQLDATIACHSQHMFYDGTQCVPMPERDCPPPPSGGGSSGGGGGESRDYDNDGYTAEDDLDDFDADIGMDNRDDGDTGW